MAERVVKLIKNLNKNKDLAQMDLYRVRINEMKPNQYLEVLRRSVYCTVCSAQIIGQARRGSSF